MGDALATMITLTTYGSWLRGDQRGWIERGGALMPANLELEARDRGRMKHPPFVFRDEQLHEIGSMLGRALIDRLDQRILALTMESWHVHVIVAWSDHPVGTIVKCAKDAARWGLRPGQPIWTHGYDKRYCLDDESVFARVVYVERHNLRAGLPAKPWDFIETIT